MLIDNKVKGSGEVQDPMESSPEHATCMQMYQTPMAATWLRWLAASHGLLGLPSSRYLLVHMDLFFGEGDLSLWGILTSTII